MYFPYHPHKLYCNTVQFLHKVETDYQKILIEEVLLLQYLLISIILTDMRFIIGTTSRDACRYPIQKYESKNRLKMQICHGACESVGTSQRP